jgi:hypothetical protein
MKNNIRFTSIVLLFFCSVSALFGGGALLFDPSGKLLGMPIEHLRYSPFDNFLAPAIILVLFVGVSSIIVAAFVMRRSPLFPLALVYQGAVLVIWIVVELIMIRSFSFLHLVYFVSGFLLFGMGIYLRERKAT